MKTKLSPLFAAVLGVTCSTASANVDLNINGFLSAGVAVGSDEDVTVGVIDEDTTFKEDTTLGIQISAPVSDRFSLTGQLVARGVEDYDIDASWAYASFEASDELTVRIGRLRIPFFYYSDFLEVGYAYNWIRPPEEVYRIGFSSVDAIDATYTTELGDVESSFQAYYGRYEEDLTVNGTELAFDLTNFFGGVATFTYEEFTGRFTYHQADVETPDSTLIADAETSWFAGAAFIYDDGANLAVVEFTTVDNDSVLTDDDAWLAMYARRLSDDLTVHFTYANENDKQDEAIQGPAGFINDQESYITGVRYDIESNVALKFEVQYNDEKTKASVEGEDAVFYSAAIDMVF
jgi:hypothetical protein